MLRSLAFLIVLAAMCCAATAEPQSSIWKRACVAAGKPLAVCCNSKAAECATNCTHMQTGHTEGECQANCWATADVCAGVPPNKRHPGTPG